MTLIKLLCRDTASDAVCNHACKFVDAVNENRFVIFLFPLQGMLPCSLVQTEISLIESIKPLQK